jgi:BirA family biotin operon repressor/biotin-[acetyl-CoA-carboxylase] ligase
VNESTTPPTRWDETALQLVTRRVGRPLWHYESVPSTMPLAHELAAQGAPDGTALIAEEQTAGRGRRGRAWQAPPGSALLCSLICRPPLPPKKLFLLVAAVGVGLCEGVERATGLQPQVKWPNDLLLDGRKLAGVLCESRLGGAGLQHAVVGFGLNINLRVDDLPTVPPGGLPPTSLAIATGSPLPHQATVRALLTALDEAYDLLWAGREHEIRARWEERLAGRGESVRVMTDNGERTGLFVGVGPDGALLLDTAGGRETILVGDVVLGPRPIPVTPQDDTIL